MKLVLIEWEDSCGCSASWFHLEDDEEPEVIICKSVGWLHYDGEDRKCLVPHWVEKTNKAKEQGCGDMTIPVSAIRSMIELKIPKSKKEKK